ncbi:MAG: response regulator transcription factor [Firmicutes bacterium]|jgi:DNA-binding NarL/FixJ family response regulator|nr:response regulator transcription factor [Bacillota bacterium]
MSEPIRVLIADDHALLREGLRHVLEMEDDIEVVGEAADGVDVVGKCRELQPDIVLMDVSMPGGGGLEATHKIKQQWPHIEVVILTVHDDQQYVADLINAGAKGYILKDVEPHRVAQVLRRVHDGEPFLEPNLMAKLFQRLQESREKAPVAATAETDPKVRLTPRELQVLELVVDGKTNKEIADTLIISEKTVKNHVTNLLKKLNLSDRTQAAVYALRHNLVPDRAGRPHTAG